MHPWRRYGPAIAVASFAPATLADFLGPRYPAPVDITSNHSLVAAAWKEVKAGLETVFVKGSGNLSATIPAAVAQNVTISVGLFSLHDPAAATYQFHYTSAEVATSPNGTHKVDGNSIYRVASVTKVFTVLAGLLELKPADWERPLSEVLPALGKPAGSGVYSTQWDKMTASALAAQIGGVPRDGFPNPGELLYQAYVAGLTEAEIMKVSGLPPYNISDPLETPPCLEYLVKGLSCPAEPYEQGTSIRPPAFSPWYTPAYSNNGFTLLGQAIGNLTGKDIQQIYRERIFAPLGLASTSSAAPPVSEWQRSVIVGNPIGNFAAENGIFVSSGGLFSTTSDLGRFGVAVLNSTLLSPEKTRRWLKPVSHTARMSAAVGAPWEILRFVHSSGVVTDIYPKSGDSGLYSAYLVLLPDYDVGFTIMAGSASELRFGVVAAVADAITDKIVPALAAQAAAEAMQSFAGRYAASGLNSSLVLSVNTSETAAPGLVVDSWISNSTSVLPWITKVLGPGPHRLILSNKDTAGKQYAFRLVSAKDVPSPDLPRALFSGPTGVEHADWATVDVNTYYGVGLTLFVFDVGADGKATGVSPAAWRITMPKAK
jgi:CubicO group peptidase (beta-lactamase class C family)